MKNSRLVSQTAFYDVQSQLQPSSSLKEVRDSFFARIDRLVNELGLLVKQDIDAYSLLIERIVIEVDLFLLRIEERDATRVTVEDLFIGNKKCEPLNYQERLSYVLEHRRHFSSLRTLKGMLDEIKKKSAVMLR